MAHSAKGLASAGRQGYERCQTKEDRRETGHGAARSKRSSGDGDRFRHPPLVGAEHAGGLGVLLIYFAFATPPANFALQAFVIVLGGLSLALMMKMHAGTSGQIDLTRAGLRDSDGTLIAPIEAIQAVERGAFAFKPSNGFLVRLDLNATEEDLPRVWRPGLWWRLGRRIGVGGVTPGNQTKIMAELLQALIVERG